MYEAQKDNYFTFGTSSVGSGPGTDLYEQEQEIKKVFGDSQTYLVLVPNSGYVDQKELAQELENIEMPTLDGKSGKVIRYAKTLANVLPVGVPDFFAPSDVIDKFKNENYTRILISARTDAESDFAFEVADKINETCKKYYGDEYYLTGTVPVTIDMKNVIESDYDIVNLLSIFLVMLVLLFSFKSLLLPVLLIAVIEGAIFINMGVPYLNEESLVFVGYLLTSTIQLGATIDYGILLTDKYLSYKEKYEKKEAAIKALSASIPSLLTSGGILIVCGYAIKFVSSITAVKDMGQCIGRGALFSLILVTLVLPQVLCLFDTWIVKTTLKNDYKLRIGSKVFNIGRKTEDENLRAHSIKNRNNKIINKVNKRIEYRKEQLINANKEINMKRILRLNKIIDKLSSLRNNLEDENKKYEEVKVDEIK
ncbi:MAG: MMPL family transporter [Clostridia bacterium]|nr:MMPL family transporter [Clostridia bacterium]